MSTKVLLTTGTYDSCMSHSSFDTSGSAIVYKYQPFSASASRVSMSGFHQVLMTVFCLMSPMMEVSFSSKMLQF